MKTITALVLLFAAASTAFSQTVRLEFDPSSPQVDYAAERLAASLVDSDYLLAASAKRDQMVISLEVDSTGLAPEAFAIKLEDNLLTIAGGDQRGVIYGTLALVEQLGNGTRLEKVEQYSESPALEFRAIKFNLPWDSYRSSSALAQHYETVRDAQYWEAFLDMMADNRFNALTLWNLHPFPYMIMPTNFPEASPFSEEELAEWRQLYQAIFGMARERGIDTYLINWNILVSQELAEAHDLGGNNHYPYYKGEADTSEVVKRYTRESVTQVLDEYPDLTGFGFSFGEQMGGMMPAERQQWMEDTVIAGMRDANRPVRMIYRVPFSADLGQGGSTDRATEELTRSAIEALDDFVEPIWVEIKFNWSHTHSTPKLVKVHGGELDDTYFSPLPENYRVAWMARNEDVYALRWGVADFIREHLAMNGNEPYVGGYFVGSENYIPARDYFTATEQPVDWQYAFERQWLFYKLWGRLLYDPSTPDSVFEAEFVRRYGESARPLLEAYALASATQLHYASAVDSSWDFTLYGEGMMVLGSADGQAMVQPMSLERLIKQPTFDPSYLSVADYVMRNETGEPFEDGTVTPVQLAQLLENNAERALGLVDDIDTSENLSLLHEVIDVKAWANLGLYFAEQLRSAVAIQESRTTGNQERAEQAIEHMDRALGYWDEVVAVTRPFYRDMPLTHYNGPDNNRNDDNLFHWELLRPQIAQDIESMKEKVRHEGLLR